MTADIYKDQIVALAKARQKDGRLDDPDASVTLDNPLCGDRITLDVKVAEGRIADIGHHVRGCMLCEAAASLIGGHAIGSAATDTRTAFDLLHNMLKNGASPNDGETWSQVNAFAPVADFKSRHECVLLPFEALAKAVDEAGK
jgi:nitrogen fixation NifU-like protein